MWDNNPFSTFNAYALNKANLRIRLWRDLVDLNAEGEQCIMGDFNMVKAKKDSLGPHPS